MIAKREWLSAGQLKTSWSIERADGPPNHCVTLSWGRYSLVYIVYRWDGSVTNSRQTFMTLDAARIAFAIHERELAISLAAHVLNLDQV